MIRSIYIPYIALVLISAVIIISALTQNENYDIALSIMLGLAMSVIVITDARYFIIPDIISLPMVILGILLSPLFPHHEIGAATILNSAIAATVGFLAFYLLRAFYYYYRKREGLGMGDVKIAAVAGAWTGLEGLNHVILLSCFLALGFLLLRYLSGRNVNATTALPLGIFLAPSIWMVWLAQSIHLF